jgi:hypothetical protein
MPSVSDPQEAPSRTSSYVLHFLPTIPQDFKNAFECIIGQCIVHPRWHHSRASSQVYGDFYICCEDVLVKIWRGKLPDLLRPRSLHVCRRRQRRLHHRDETAINAQNSGGRQEPSGLRLHGRCVQLVAHFQGAGSPLCATQGLGGRLCLHPPGHEDRLRQFSRRPQGQGFLSSPVKIILSPRLISYFSFLFLLSTHETGAHGEGVVSNI